MVCCCDIGLGPGPGMRKVKVAGNPTFVAVNVKIRMSSSQGPPNISPLPGWEVECEDVQVAKAIIQICSSQPLDMK